MTTNYITVLTDVSLITCIVQRDLADDIVAAAQSAGAQGATIHYAHGTGDHELLGTLSVAIEVEKEVINILVANDQVDRIFEAIHVAGKFDTLGMGMLYITKLDEAATYIHPEVMERLELDNE